MWPVLAHHCDFCSHDSPVPYTASVFSEHHYCNNCGAIASGVAIQSRLAKQDAMQQDELAGLFARNMTFSNPTPPPDEQQMLPRPSEPKLEPQPQPAVYASSHYVPNKHMLPVRFHSTPQASPEPEPAPQVQSLSDSEMIEILNRNSIDPHTLFPSQVVLFRNADNDQRLRLLELWRISPPNLGSYDLAQEQATWMQTTLQQEETMARIRYERLVAERSFGKKDTGLTVMVEPERPASAPESRARRDTHAEPYMTNGYEMLAQREYERSQETALRESTRYNQSIDPVFRGSETWDKNVSDMENRYGAYEQMRDNHAPTQMALNGLDEDMVM